MFFKTPFLKSYIHRFLICVCVLMPTGVQAEILSFKKVSFIRENNGGAANFYSQLLFKVDYPVIGTNKYLNRNSIMFTFDTDKNLNRIRTDIRFKRDWLKPRKFKSSNNKYNDFYIGSHNLNRNHISDLGTLSQEEKTVLAWMIVNSDELINYALESKKFIPSGSRAYWERVVKGQKFEKNVRKFIGPEVRSKIKEYDNFKHSTLALKRVIQPNLKGLGYYDGAIDGIPGPRTTKAIKAFEKENNLLADGIIRGEERTLLTRLAIIKSKQNQIKKTTTFDNNKIVAKKTNQEIVAANQRRVIRTLRARISELNKESTKNKGTLIQSLKNEKMVSDQKFFDLNKGQKKLELTVQNQRNIIKTLRSRITQLTSERNNSGISENNQELNKQIIKTLRQRISELAKQRNSAKSAEANKDLENMVQGQKNIIKNLRKRAAVLIKERNKYRDNNDNGVISVDPVIYNDLVRTSKNQRKIIVSLRQRLTDTQNERNKLRNNAKKKSDGSTGGSNKYLITSLKNELNSLQIRYDVILKQRDELRNATTGVNISGVNYSSKIQEKLDDLKKELLLTQAKLREKLKLNEFLTEDTNRFKKKYSTLYAKNNNLKFDFQKLDREYKQLSDGLKEKNNEINALEYKLKQSLIEVESDPPRNVVEKLQVKNDALEKEIELFNSKYQKLYRKNNDINIDFSKLGTKNKQLSTDLKVKDDQIDALKFSLKKLKDNKNLVMSKDVERLQKTNEELSISLQKQKILAYDAISQKSAIEQDLKIARGETIKLDNQLNDLRNVENANNSLKIDLDQARFQISSIKEKLDISRNSASADLAKAVAKITMLEVELKKSENKFAELEKQKNSTKNGQQRGFVLSSEWDELKQWITPQQIRFCTILSDYDLEKVSAQESGNQLKQNLAIDNRDSDIDALLLGRNSQEKGYFRNWIGTVEQVFAIYQENEDGDEELAAGVVIKTPCNSVTVGSGRVKSADNERYEGTAFPSDPIYSQLSQVSKGDPILFEGSLLTYQDTGEANRSSKPRFFTNVDSSVNDVEAEKAKKRDKINAPDYFVKIDYLSKL